MSFYIGRLRSFRWSEVKHIASYDDLKNVTQGDIVETFGHVFQWDEDCVPVELCERWRQTGDTVCDAALREVFPHPAATVGKDLLQCITDHVASAGDVPSASQAFLSEVLQAPPGVVAAESDVTAAQEFFLDNSVQIMQALLHYSLAGGLASSRIVRTLDAVSYLLPHVKKPCIGRSAPSLADIVAQISRESTDRTFVRLVETMQFVLDVMGCSAATDAPQPSPQTYGRLDEDGTSERLTGLLPGGDGWKSAVRVRLLHGVARWRAQTRWEREDHAGNLDSVPISQEEVAATLGAFSTIPIWCLQRLHLPPSNQHINAYLALWRHVGYYMGVSPSILLRYFTTTNAADKFIATAALNLFLEQPPTASSSPPSGSPDILRGPTIPILVAVSHRPPLNTSLEYNIALTTHLLGRPLATHLGLPDTSLATRLRMHAFLLIQRIPQYFAQLYPRRAWLAKRRAALQEGMVLTVRWNMGMRKTAFRPRTMGHDLDGKGGAAGGGELAPGVAEEEHVERQPVRARLLTRQWKEVLYEMVAVCLALGVLGAALGYLCISYVLSFALTLEWF